MNKSVSALLALLIAAFVLPASAAGPLRDYLEARSAHSVHANETASGQRQFLVHDGLTRSYVVRMPNALQPDRRVPLVIVLHGGGGDAESAEAMTGFTEKARKEGFIVVYPDGSRRLKNRLLTWNAGHCCGYALGYSDIYQYKHRLISKLLIKIAMSFAHVLRGRVRHG